MLLTKILALPLSLGLAAASGGMDMDYEGEIDPMTGQPVAGVSVQQEEDNQQTVTISESVSYDRKTHCFSYVVPDRSGVIKTNVADGFIAVGTASIEVPTGISAALFRNGDEQTETDLEHITKEGVYALVVTNPDSQYQLLTFTLVPQKTNMISTYPMPAGFQLTGLELNGEKKNVAGLNTVDLSADGKYRITYRCSATAVDYNLNVEIDHTPPAIVLEGVTNGVANGPVKIQGISKGDTYEIYRDNVKVVRPLALSNVFKTPGDYRVTVSDDAGNVVVEKFTIRFYLNFQGLIFTLIALAVAVGIAAYMYISKKRLKVR